MRVERSPTKGKLTVLSLGALLGALAMMVACDGREPPSDAGTDPSDAGTDPQGGPVTIHFEHLVDGAALELGVDATGYTNAAGNQYGLSKLEYFVTDVTLTMADDSQVAAAGPHYVDHETAVGVDYLVANDVPPAELKSISFTMGIPAGQNVTGSMPNPPETLMEWPVSMGGGYHYMKLEGRYTNVAGDPANLRAHTGPTDGDDFSFPVALDATGKSIPDSGATLVVQMNIEQWFTDPHTWNFNEYFDAPGIMDDPVKQTELKENGATVFTLGE